MKRLLLALLLLAACRDEAPPGPVAMTPESVGFFCQMNILDHGGPKAQVHLAEFPGKPLFFSQVRDALAYLAQPEKDGTVVAAYVTDMGSAAWEAPTEAKWIALDKAAFVLGSDRLGGMDQPEAIPFADRAEAARFVQAHGGKVLSRTEIPRAALVPAEAEATPADDTDFASRLKSLAVGD